jgi:NADPH:quinone reductase-like Zn-dependent oxidoreductase
LGTLGVYKFKVAYNPENTKNWKVDFKATKEAGHVVYYGSTYGYMWKWSKKHAKFKGKKWYNFKPCRTASRLIADAVNNKELDFYEYKHKEA